MKKHLPPMEARMATASCARCFAGTKVWLARPSRAKTKARVVGFSRERWHCASCTAFGRPIPHNNNSLLARPPTSAKMTISKPSSELASLATTLGWLAWPCWPASAEWQVKRPAPTSISPSARPALVVTLEACQSLKIGQPSDPADRAQVKTTMPLQLS